MNFTTTLQDYKYAIRRNLSLAVTDTANLEWPDDLLTEKINEARQEFWDSFSYINRYGVLYQNAVAGTSLYDVPTAMDRIHYVRYNDGTQKQLLQKITLEALLALTSTQQNGFSYFFAQKGNQIEVYPTPSTSVTNGIEFYGKVGLTDLSDDTDVDSDIEKRFKRLIVAYATGLCWEVAEQATMATKWMSRYEKQRLDMAYELNTLADGQNVHMGLPAGVIDELDETRYGTLT